MPQRATRVNRMIRFGRGTIAIAEDVAYHDSEFKDLDDLVNKAVKKYLLEIMEATPKWKLQTTVYTPERILELREK